MGQTTVSAIPVRRFFNGSGTDRLQVALLGVVTLAYVAAIAVFLVIFPPPLHEQHYTLQATAWLSGRLDVPSNAGLPDLADYRGKSYVISGPLPSVLLLPLNWLSGRTLPQEWLGYLLTAVNFYLLLWIGRLCCLRWVDCWWLGCSYLFGSVYLYVSLAFISPYLLQVLATTGLLLAIGAALAQQQRPMHVWCWGWCGFGVAIAGLCRLPLFLAAVPFVLMVVCFGSPSAVRRRQLWWLLIPILAGAVGATIFNFVRFGAWFEAGYHYWNWQSRGGFPARLLSFRYIPTNLYYALLAMPEFVVPAGRWTFPYLKPNLWGTSILVTSPVLLWLFVRRPRGMVAMVFWLAVFVLAIPVLMYAGIGAKQIGYRYALDFLPFLYVLLLLTANKKLPTAVKVLMLFGMVTNAWLILGALVP